MKSAKELIKAILGRKQGIEYSASADAEAVTPDITAPKQDIKTANDYCAPPTNSVISSDSWEDDFRIVSLFSDGNVQHLFFHDNGSKGSRILRYLCERDAISIICIQNAIEEDSTMNYHAVFRLQQELSLIKYCLSSASPLIIDRDCPRHGIYSYGIYNIPIDDFQTYFVNQSKLADKRCNGYSRLNAQTVDFVLRQLYESFGETYNPDCFPRAFVDFMKNVLGLKLCPVNDYYEKQQEEINIATQKMADINASGKYKSYKLRLQKEKDHIRTEYNAIYSELLSSGEIKSKWNSEYSLFTMVKKLYPDTIYQYHAQWLGRQSLDIFIPSKRVGIEYQGQQHYQAVALFGGQEALNKRQLLDARKRNLCKAQKVKLIEIRYDEIITSKAVQQLVEEQA